jgi:hypothetical protein
MGIELSKNNGAPYASDDIVENLRPLLFVYMKVLEMAPKDVPLERPA